MMKVVVCPECNQANPGSKLHCTKCGASLVGLPLLQEQEREVTQGQAVGLEQGTNQVQDIHVLEAKLRVENQFKSGAGWFYWIAGLSLINSVIMMVGGGWSFMIGLGITQLIDAIAGVMAEGLGSDMGVVIRLVAFVLDVVIAGIVVGFGMLARKRHKWAFIVGMVLYALDGLIFLWAGDYLSMGFHLFVLFWLYQGVRALNQLAVLEQPVSEMAP
jgi:hypothetical protein